MTSQRASVLVVDDDGSVLESVRRGLRGMGYVVDTAAWGQLAQACTCAPPDVVLLERHFPDAPDADGLDLLRLAMRLDPAPTIVMITGDAGVASVVEAIRLGAFDYLAKPFREDELRATIERAMTARRAAAGEPHWDDFPEIVGCSPAIENAKSLLRRIAASRSSTVLITGESGTGKDLAAKAIHARSDRANGPFVNVTCSALASNLLESELFGHERGAFTDAKVRKLGLVEQASGGTLFLDEMGEMEPALQAKLLRFLEEKAFRRVGGSADLFADVRVIAATNVDLPAAVSSRRFREDLYYRLAVLTVEVPSLRERPGDVARLARHFLAGFAREFDKPLHGFSPRAMSLLEAHRWPGNVRELKNTIERAALLTHRRVLDRDDFALTPSATDSASCPSLALPPGGVDLHQLECSLVRQALSRCRGNVTRAARLLGLNRDQVRYRVDKFSLEDELVAQRAG